MLKIFAFCLWMSHSISSHVRRTYYSGKPWHTFGQDIYKEIYEICHCRLWSLLPAISLTMPPTWASYHPNTVKWKTFHSWNALEYGIRYTTAGNLYSAGCGNIPYWRLHNDATIQPAWVENLPFPNQEFLLIKINVMTPPLWWRVLNCQINVIHCQGILYGIVSASYMTKISFGWLRY